MGKGLTSRHWLLLGAGALLLAGAGCGAIGSPRRAVDKEATEGDATTTAKEAEAPARSVARDREESPSPGSAWGEPVMREAPRVLKDAPDPGKAPQGGASAATVDDRDLGKGADSERLGK